MATYYRTTRGPLGHRTVATAETLGLDSEDGKWVVVCEDHKTLISTSTRNDARQTCTTEFCDDCRSGHNTDGASCTRCGQGIYDYDETCPGPADAA